MCGGECVCLLLTAIGDILFVDSVKHTHTTYSCVFGVLAFN